MEIATRLDLIEAASEAYKKEHGDDALAIEVDEDEKENKWEDGGSKSNDNGDEDGGSKNKVGEGGECSSENSSNDDEKRGVVIVTKILIIIW
jgi:hypothetical protein